jgi:hypothetical protein
MRPNAIFVGFAVLAAIFAGIAYIQFALLGIGALVFLVLGWGILSGEYRQRRIQLPAGSNSGSDQTESPGRNSVRIERREFQLNAMPSCLDLVISRRNYLVVIGIALIALSATLISISSLRIQHIDIENPRFYLFYALCFLVAFLLIPSLMWAGECALMNTPGITLAQVYGPGANRLGAKWLTYGFTLPNGEHHGGSTIDLGSSKGDDYKLVFCDPRNPDRNKLSCSLLFHRVAWQEVRVKHNS